MAIPLLRWPNPNPNPNPNPHPNPNPNPNQVAETSRAAVLAEALCSLLACLFAAGAATHQLHELGAPTCASTADAAAEQLQATLLHNRWNVFTGAEPYVVWEMAPAKLGDGRVVDLWRDTEQARPNPSPSPSP